MKQPISRVLPSLIVGHSLVMLLALLLATYSAKTFSNGSASDNSAGDDWSYYRGNPSGTHYSQLREINTRTVAKLKLAWTYDTGDKLKGNSTMESNPLAIGGQLFFVSPLGRLISLDGATGEERWTFEPPNEPSVPDGFARWRRGVSYWTDGIGKRIYFTFGDELYAIDAQSGRAIETFGSQGRISLEGRAASPGVIYDDLIIVGGSQSSIRAFDVHTGQLRWTFHTIPRPGEFGHDTWPRDAWKTAVGVNNWSGMTLDRGRGIVYVPLAFPQTIYGGNRIGDNLFGNSLVALDAKNGRRLWHFQAVRHDVWDRDLPAPPTLVTVRRDGISVPAVAQTTKQGFVFVLDRRTGESLFPIVERPAFDSDTPGEVTAKTQPEPLLPAPFVRQHLTSDILTARTPEAARTAAAQFATLRSRGLWDPPSLQGTIMFPGLDGGAEWGGAAYDLETGTLYVNSNEVPWILKLRRVSTDGMLTGRDVYKEYCSSCHGEDRAGRLPEFPSLLGVGTRFTFAQMVAKIAHGAGRMPAFPNLATDEARLLYLITYLRTGDDAQIAPSRRSTSEYLVDGVPKFVDPDGYPAVSPPWGTLNAINLNTGHYEWRTPLGEYPELVAKGVKDTGSENYGGAVVTAGGLLFIGATSFDNKFRAFDKRTGKLLWEAVLPAPGNATPATYKAKGRQFVVIAAGGGRPSKAASGGSIVAFTLAD